MKKSASIVIALVISAAAGIAYVAFNHKPAPETKRVVQPACQVLTPAIAKQVLGATITAGDRNDDPPNQSEDIAISTCSYQTGDDSATSGLTATVLVRAAKTAVGASENKTGFRAQRPAGAQDVTGYGAAAFWDPAEGQLHVLQAGNWYIISYGPAAVDARTIDQSKQLADAIQARF